MLRRIGSRKWPLVVGALVIVVSLGAVACGSSAEDQEVAGVQQGLRDRLEAQKDAQGRAGQGVRPGVAQRREAAQDQAEARAERQKALVESLRDDMSAEDQALFDELKAKIADLRQELVDSRQELADTLDQLRELTDNYLDLGDAEEGQ